MLKDQQTWLEPKMEKTHRSPAAARRVDLLLATASIAFLAFGFAHAQTDAKASKPFAYSGFSEPAYKGISVTSEYVPMSGGAKLATDIYRPADGPECKAFPVVVEYLPYQRSRIDPVSGEMQGHLFHNFVSNFPIASIVFMPFLL